MGNLSFKRILGIFVLLVVIGGISFDALASPQNDFAKGRRAYNEKNFVVAAEYFQKAAAQGNARAQEVLESLAK